MSKDFIKTKSWFDTLSEIIKDEFIGLNLSKDIGEKLIRENTVKKTFNLSY